MKSWIFRVCVDPLSIQTKNIIDTQIHDKSFHSRFTHSRFTSSAIATATGAGNDIKERDGEELGSHSKEQEEKRCWSSHQKAQILNNVVGNNSNTATIRHEIEKHIAVKIFSKNHKFYGWSRKSDMKTLFISKEINKRFQWASECETWSMKKSLRHNFSVGMN